MKQIYRTGQEAHKNDRVRYNQTIADGEGNTIAAGTETRVVNVAAEGLYVVGYRLLINPQLFDLVADSEGNVRKQKRYRSGEIPLLRDKVRSIDPQAGQGVGTYLDVKGITTAGDIQFDDGGGQSYDPQMFALVADRFGNPRLPSAPSWPRYITRSDSPRWLHDSRGYYCVVQLGPDLDGNWMYQNGVIEGVVRADTIEQHLAADTWMVLPGKPDFASIPEPVEQVAPVDWSKPLTLRRGGKVELLRSTTFKGEVLYTCLVTDADDLMWSSVWNAKGVLYDRYPPPGQAEEEYQMINAPPEPKLASMGSCSVTMHKDPKGGHLFLLHTSRDVEAQHRSFASYEGTWHFPEFIEFKKP